LATNNNLQANSHVSILKASDLCHQVYAAVQTSFLHNEIKDFIETTNIVLMFTTPLYFRSQEHT